MEKETGKWKGHFQELKEAIQTPVGWFLVVQISIIILIATVILGLHSGRVEVVERAETGPVIYDGSFLNMEGLPPFITEEMMIALFYTQEHFALPVSVGIAQIIQEGGFGAFGPGGQENQGLSSLSYDYHNLFGIKFWDHNFPVDFSVGSVIMNTFEEEDGQYVWRDYAFMTFDSFHDAIIFRAHMLTSPPYYEVISSYLNEDVGRYATWQADRFARSFANIWATHGIMADRLVAHMERWDLYRFDNLTLDDLILPPVYMEN